MELLVVYFMAIAPHTIAGHHQEEFGSILLMGSNLEWFACSLDCWQGNPKSSARIPPKAMPHCIVLDTGDIILSHFSI